VNLAQAVFPAAEGTAVGIGVDTSTPSVAAIVAFGTAVASGAKVSDEGVAVADEPQATRIKSKVANRSEIAPRIFIRDSFNIVLLN